MNTYTYRRHDGTTGTITADTDHEASDAVRMAEGRHPATVRTVTLLEENRRLREALKPFAHPDLCKALAGNGTGDTSPIFERDKATILLGDCRRARALLFPNEEPPHV